jgi:hypothetical protein
MSWKTLKNTTTHVRQYIPDFQQGMPNAKEANITYSTYGLEAEPQVRQKRSWNERGRRESKEKNIYNNNI